MSGVKFSGQGLEAILEAVDKLSKTDVLVGIPHGEDRLEDDQLSNAQIGYLLETGSPAMNLPARPFLIPGTERVQKVVTDRLLKAVDAALEGNIKRMEMHLGAAGTKAMNSVRMYFVDGTFAPLSMSTIRARANRGRRGAKKYLKQIKFGPPEAGLVNPLRDTGQLRKSVTYVIMHKDKEIKRG